MEKQLNVLYLFEFTIMLIVIYSKLCEVISTIMIAVISMLYTLHVRNRSVRYSIYTPLYVHKRALYSSV